ncbi:IPTL-CTERM sorting domain-containing protein [Comamonas odontotermitis]|uniref:IPTL-CTERM sorting domain-containing protein n=1 Tax=Comamonas odontotermitis TaxID=379895 RepID=UPI00375209CA
MGEDNSFQITSNEVSGRGLIQPYDTVDGTADMGFVVAWSGALFKPDFSQHPGTHITDIALDGTPYTPQSLSPVSGSGTQSDPFTVTVKTGLGTTGVTATLTVQYVNGNHYFTKALKLDNSPAGSTRDAKIFLGAAVASPLGDGWTRPYLETATTSVGGHGQATGAPASNGCAVAGSSPYSMLLVPETAPDAYFAGYFNSIWRQIDRAQLENRVDTSCDENGGALQWNRALAPAGSVMVQSRMSFSEIAAPAEFKLQSVTPSSLAAGASVDVTLNGFGFQPATTFDFGSGISVSNLAITSTSTASATLNAAPSAAPGPRDVRATQASGGVSTTLSAGISVAAAPGRYTIGGTVSGLVGSGLVLAEGSSGQTLPVNANGNFGFPATLADASAYAVTVSSQPTLPAQTCSVAQSSGTVSGANVNDITVTCVVTGQAPTALTLMATPNPIVAGQPITLTATVTPTSKRATAKFTKADIAKAAASGSVTFNDNGIPIGSAPVGPDGTASLTTSNLSVGIHALTANYSGDAANAPSDTQAPLSVVVRDGSASSSPIGVPTLSAWALLALSLGLFGLGWARRRDA